MNILDEGHLLSEAEKEAYYNLLKKYGYDFHDFKLFVTEDQKPMDMNDINYVIVVKVKAKNLINSETRIYESSAGSGVWLSEMEEDLMDKAFTSD